MRHRTIAIACAVAFLVLTSKPVGAVDCVEAHVTLTAESGEQYVRSCTQSTARERPQQPIGNAGLHNELPARAQVVGGPPITTQSAKAR